MNKYQIPTNDCFIDGTKIEANANKYKFVYKPTTFKINLFDKIKSLLVQYFQLSEKKKTFISKEIASYVAKTGMGLHTRMLVICANITYFIYILLNQSFLLPL